MSTNELNIELEPVSGPSRSNFELRTDIAPQIRARIELTPTAVRRQDEIESYLELARDYSDEHLVLCLNLMGDRYFYPMANLRVWIEGLLEKNGHFAAQANSKFSDEIVERADHLYLDAKRRFKEKFKDEASRRKTIEEFAPAFPLPQDWLERLAILGWSESDTEDLARQIWS